MSIDNDIDLISGIEACRTCGIFFLTSSSFLRPLFTAPMDDPEMMYIRVELSAWKIDINENDGYPQFICTGCIHEFQKIFNFRRSCVDIQQQLLHFYNLRSKNQIQIKTELPDEIEEKQDFIYVDDLSDTEYSGTAFNIPHIPIKEEIIEAATIPSETPTTVIGTASTKTEDNQIENDNNAALLNSEIADVGIPTMAENLNSLKPIIATAEGTATYGSSLVKCEHCNCVSSNHQQHKLHLKRVHDIQDLECRICGKTFKGYAAARLKFHLKWHKLNRHIKCAQCGYYCTSRDALKEHQSIFHSKDNCSICGKFVLLKKMKVHMRRHGFDTLFECTHCTQVFRSDDDVNKHIKEMHNTENKSDEEKNESRPENTSDNAAIEEVSCLLCNMNFVNKSELELHLQEQHSNDTNVSSSKLMNDEFNNQPLYGFSNKDDDEEEETSSENNKLLRSLKLNDATNLHCSKCQQLFLQHEQLEQHLLECRHNHQSTIVNHDDNANDIYKNICSEANNDEYLDNYETTEPQIAGGDEIDEFNCDGMMNDDCSQLSTFECAQCTDIFGSVEQLREHYDKMHSKKQTFNCHICAKVFALKFNLNRHMKKHSTV